MLHKETATDGPLLLGLDAGTSRMKAVLIDRDGAEVALADRPTPFVTGPSGTDMGVDDLLRSVAALLADLGAARDRVAALGIAALGESGAPLGRDGAPLAPVIAWHDPRGAETVAELERRFGPGLALRTGQRPRTVSSVAKLGWLTTHGFAPNDVRRWLGVAELCLHRLTGTEATEHSFACRTGCYDIVERAWMPEVAEVAEVPIGIFPPVRTAGEPMGAVTAEAARWSGLPAGVPVTLAGHDHLAGAAGAGARPGDLVNSVGTAETVLRHLTALPDLGTAAEVRAAVSIHPGGDGWAAMTGAARAGVVLGRAAEALGMDPAKLDRLAEDAAPVEAAQLVRDLQANPGTPLPEDDAGAIWRGLLEALTDRTFEAASRLETVAAAPQRLLVFGGGSRSRLWMELKARTAPTPVAVPRVAEAAGRGAALFAGVAAGWWPSVDSGPAPATDAVTPGQSRS